MADKIYKVRDPSGAIREIRGPAGASDDEVIAQAQKLFGGQQSSAALPNKPVTLGKEGFAETLREEYNKAPWIDRQLIAAGTGLSDLFERGKQLIGKTDEPRIEANRTIARENPAAAIAGNIALFAPTAMIPGANTYTGAALTGAVLGAAQPTIGDESTLKNVAIGSAASVGGKALGDVVSRVVASRAAQRAALQSKNAVRDATLREGQKAGYVVPKSEVSPSFLNNRLESIGGKAALGQQASTKNQEVTNALARKALGMADDTPISTQALESVRYTAAEPYRQIASLDKTAARALERLKDARHEATTQWNYYTRSANPQALKDAKAAMQQADILERLIEKSAQKANQPGLLGELKQARALIAKTYDVERALNVGTGDVSARTLGRAFDRSGKLTGELATVGRFAEAFPRYVKEGSVNPSSGVSKSEAITSAILGTLGYGAGGPAGLMAAALPLASAPTRSMLLSAPYQRLVTPRYAQPILESIARRIAPQLPVAAAGGALETLP